MGKFAAKIVSAKLAYLFWQIRSRGYRLAIVLVLSLLSAGPARADLLHVSFTGTMILVDSALASEFSIGDPVAGSLTVNLSALGTGVSTYTQYPNSADNLAASFDDYALTSVGLGRTLVWNEASFDEVRHSWDGGLDGLAVNGLPLWGFELFLIDLDATAFSDESLPLVLSLADFENTQATISFGQPGDFNFARASLDSLEVAVEVTPVPLPAALPLFAGGLGLLGWMARRKRREVAYA